MDSVIGIVGLAIFIVCVIGLSAGVTALVVRISPTRSKPKQTSASS
jgi:hypothetical protein